MRFFFVSACGWLKLSTERSADTGVGSGSCRNDADAVGGADASLSGSNGSSSSRSFVLLLGATSLSSSCEYQHFFPNGQLPRKKKRRQGFLVFFPPCLLSVEAAVVSLGGLDVALVVNTVVGGGDDVDGGW